MPAWRLRLLRALRSLFTPLLPDDYLELINPLWSTQELRGSGVKKARSALSVLSRQAGTFGRAPRSAIRRCLSHWIWMPEIARAITSRWISEVPSKIV